MGKWWVLERLLTIGQRRNALERHAKPVFVQETRWVVEELDVANRYS